MWITVPGGGIERIEMEDYSKDLTFDHPDQPDAGSDWTMHADSVWITVDEISIQIRKADHNKKRFLIIETFPKGDEAASGPIETITQRI